MTDTTPATDRSRATAGAFLAVALGATGYIPAISAAALAARDMLGSPFWSGLPSAVAIAGTAVGTSLLALAMTIRSRRFGLTLGFVIAAAAAALAAAAVERGSFALFLAAMFALGIGYGARHLARYVVSEAWRPERRGASIGLIVWAGTIGAVISPLLLAPSEGLALALGLVGLVGPYLLCAAVCVAAAVALLVTTSGEPTRQVRTGASAFSRLRATLPAFAAPRLRFAVIAMTGGQFVMVVVMAMTPLHIDGAGEGLAAVGVVIGAHTLGMFALSPLTGLLSDRWGRVRVIVAGQAMLFSASLIAAASRGDDRGGLVVALFLLGLGWNFGFISSSALLSEMDEAPGRLGAQGAVDTLVWLTAAIGSLAAGVLVGTLGYRGLCFVGALFALVPLMVALRDRRELVPTDHGRGVEA